MTDNRNEEFDPQVDADLEPLPAEGGEVPAEPDRTREYVEYVGTSVADSPEFVASRTITRRDAKEGAWDLKMDKDLVWTKETRGKRRGRMLLPTADLSADVLEALREESGFKIVSLND